MPAPLRGPFKLTRPQRKAIMYALLVLLLAAMAVFVVIGPGKGLVADLLGVIPVSSSAGTGIQAMPEQAGESHGQPKRTATLQELIATATRTIIPARTLPAATAAVDPAGTVSYGDHGVYQIHKVVKGESLESLAGKYESSPEAITAVNHFLPSPLWDSWLMVIPEGVTDPKGLPSFEVYLVPAEASVAELAQKLEVDTQALTKYNGLEASGRVPIGTWLLVLKNGANSE